MNDQILSLCRSCNFHLRRLASIRSFMTEDNIAQLVSSLILSRLDYCNSVLIGLPSSTLHRLQKVQNNAARLVLRRRKFDHVTPLLMQPHWLPINFRIQYKLATLAFRHFDGSLPPYLSSLLQTYTPPRMLRSSSEKLLRVCQFNLKSVGNRGFRVQAPKVWNSLPASLRNISDFQTFKSNLKTHLFRQAFLSLK